MDNIKRRRTQSIGSDFSSPRTKIRNSVTNKTLEEVFMDADVNLSDNSSEQMSQDKSNCEERLNASRKSTHSYSLRNYSSSGVSNFSEMIEPNTEEYFVVPKKEYEEFVRSTSKTRDPPDFKSVPVKTINVQTIDPVSNVQSEYEKTLEESSIESTCSTDQLAKRLSRELKIRRSAEHKVIRSPSARKIGSIRRRSQEKPVR